MAAIGSQAQQIVAAQPWHFAVGPRSPFAHVLDLDGHILLIGVSHNRNSFLHHAESLTASPRLKQRRFPMLVDGERVWWETVDVGDDNDTYFPTVGKEFEHKVGVASSTVGAARVVLFRARPFVAYAIDRLTELLAESRANDSDPHQ